MDLLQASSPSEEEGAAHSAEEEGAAHSAEEEGAAVTVFMDGASPHTADPNPHTSGGKLLLRRWVRRQRDSTEEVANASRSIESTLVYLQKVA